MEQVLWSKATLNGRWYFSSFVGCGQVFAWGCNTSGQLGLGDYQNRRAPCVIDGLWAMPVAALAAGEAHSAALTANGFMFTWGANDRGQLGLPKKAEIAAQVRPICALPLLPANPGAAPSHKRCGVAACCYPAPDLCEPMCALLKGVRTWCKPSMAPLGRM